MIQSSVEDNQEVSPSLAVTLSPQACKYIKEKIQQRKKGIGVRLAVKMAGCSGLKYVFDYVENQDPEDYCFTTLDQSIAVYVDKKSYPFVKGTEIDYIFEKFNSRLIFNNPNVKNACGCGESFTVESLV